MMHGDGNEPTTEAVAIIEQLEAVATMMATFVDTSKEAFKQIFETQKEMAAAVARLDSRVRELEQTVRRTSYKGNGA